MEEKVIKFDMSADRLLDIADARIDEGDYLSALRMLHKSLDLYGDGADEYVALADTYDEMELFELSANCWFRYLDICPEEEAVDAYEGLAACFYNMGNEQKAVYYYNKMMHDKYVSPANNVEMGELFDKAPRKTFKVTWPPEYADYSEEIDEGLKALKQGNYSLAHECFGRVDSKSEYYAAAMNYTAVCYLLEGKTDEAEQTCLKLLEKTPDDVQALSSYAAVLSEQNRTEEGYRTALKLASLETKTPDELYKAATVCCENKLYAQAFEKFSELEKTVSYDLTLLYFKAISAFKCGKVKECVATLGKILDIYPRAAVTRYFYREIRRYYEKGGPVPETYFFYRLPKGEREERLKLLMALADLRSADLIAYCEETDIEELLDWCFDEADAQEPELQILAMIVAVKAELDGFVRTVLLASGVSEVVKIETLRRVFERNRDCEFGVVVADIYRRIPFPRLQVGRTKRAKFVGAYALCCSRFGVIGDSEARVFCDAAREVYAALERDDKLSLASDQESLACAISLIAEPANARRTRDLLQFLGGEAKTVAAILGCVHCMAEKEVAVTREEITEKDGEESAAEGNGDETD